MARTFGDIEIALIAALRDGAPHPDPRAMLVEEAPDGLRLTARLEGSAEPLSAIGVRLRVTGARRYLRNGYHSWDGSAWNTAGGAGEGFAVTALLGGKGCAILGFERQDRFQTRFRFVPDGDGLLIDVETMLDGTGAVSGETLPSGARWRR